MTLSRTATIPAHVLARELEGEIVILDLESGTYFGLDPVGARIWQLLAERRSLGDVCEAILKEFDASREEVETDVVRLTDDLAAKKLIQFE